MSYQLDFIAVSASCLALFFILRAKRTYFLDSRFFMALANVGFIAYLTDATYSDIAGFPVSIIFDTILISIMAVSIGMAAYFLRSGDEKNLGGVSQLRRIVTRMPISLQIYLSIVAVWTFSSLVLQPWTLNMTGGSYYYASSGWFIVESVILLASFIGLPVLSFYRQSRVVRQKTASLSIKIISVCWAWFGVSIFIQTVAGSFLLPNAQSVGLIVDSFLFVLVSFALREPTVLARIIAAGETVSQAISSQSESDTIILYNTDSDRRNVVEAFVKDGFANGQDLTCHVAKADVPFYTALLRSPGIAGLSINRRGVTIQPLQAASMLSPIPGSSPREKRELVDLDQFGLDRSREIIDHIDAKDRYLITKHAGRIWALNVEGARAGILDVLTARNPGSRVVDLARQQDVFSELLHMKHQDILGRRLLLEYEPTSTYEDVVKKFVKEFQSNVESVAIFTSGGSPIYRQFCDQRNIRLFSFSTKTSTPARLNDEMVLLPERDTSLLLDAVDKLLQAHTGRRIGIVFEVFTYLILSLGFDKAYGVISSIVEMSESELATILVLVNSDALEPRVLNGMRGLFQSQLHFDSEGLRATRMEKGKYDHGETDSLSDQQNSTRGIGL